MCVCVCVLGGYDYSSLNSILHSLRHSWGMESGNVAKIVFPMWHNWFYYAHVGTYKDSVPINSQLRGGSRG